MLPEPQRIAVFSLAYLPFEGGAEIALREVMTRTPAARFTVFTHRFDARWPREEATSNVTAIRLGKGRRTENYYGGAFGKTFYVFRAWRAAERLHRVAPFHTVWGVMAAYAGVAALLFKLRHPSVPFLLTLQEGDAERQILSRVGVWRPLWRLIFRKADRIHAISSYLADFGRRQGARCRIDVVPNGVDINRFARASRRRRISLEHPTVITTSRLVRKNGVDVLIRAVSVLKKKRRGVRAVIVGDGPERAAYEKLAREEGVGTEVFFTGQVAAADIPRYLQDAQIFARPSRSEGLGSSFIEAMAMGLPVVGTNVGGIPDFLHDGATGLVARVDDPHDIAAKIEALMDDPAMRVRLAKEGERFVRSRHSWDNIAEAMREILCACMRRRRLLVMTGIFPPEIGGAATYAATLKNEFPEYGYDVTVLTYGEGKTENGVHYISRRNAKGFRHLRYAAAAVRLGRRHDVMLAADSSFGAATVGACAAALVRRPCIVRVTGDYAWEQGRQRFSVKESMDDFQKRRYAWAVGVLRACQSFAAKRAARVFVPSEYLKGIAAGWGVDPMRIRVIYNAVEKATDVSKRDARRRLKLEGMIAVSAGRLVPWKGFGRLIEIMPRLLKMNPRFRLLIAGDGPDREKLEALARSNSVEKCVTFTGLIPRKLLHEYLAAADVFVLNTSYEGFSHQILEALAYDVPVVTTRAGGNTELMKGGYRIFPVAHDDGDGLVRAITGAVAPNAKRRHSRRNGALLATTFSKERMLEGIEREVNAVAAS